MPAQLDERGGRGGEQQHRAGQPLPRLVRLRRGQPVRRAEDEFAFGLSTVLDGIEKRMGRRRATRRAGRK
jgi:hypothetical protein